MEDLLFIGDIFYNYGFFHQKTFNYLLKKMIVTKLFEHLFKAF